MEPVSGASQGRWGTRHDIVDPQHGGLPVATFQHPAEWQARSQVQWNFQNTSQPVFTYASAVHPDGSEGVEFLPAEGCYWLEPNYGTQPVGQQRLGLTLLPPMSGLDAMVRWLIPKYRGNRENLRLIGSGQVPDLARRLNAVELQDVATTGVMASIEYDERGRHFAEELYGCHYMLPPIPGQVTQQNWGLVRPFAFRTDPARLEERRPTFMRVAASMFYNAQWLQLYGQVVQQLHGQFTQRIQAGYDKLRSEAQFQQQLTSFYQQQRDNQNAAVAASVHHQSEVNAARSSAAGGGEGQSAADAWGDQLSGRVAYEDPNSQYGNYHYHYGGNEYVWTDGQGNFEDTDDPTVDPNIGSDRTWTRAKRA